MDSVACFVDSGSSNRASSESSSSDNEASKRTSLVLARLFPTRARVAEASCDDEEFGDAGRDVMGDGKPVGSGEAG